MRWWKIIYMHYYPYKDSTFVIARSRDEAKKKFKDEEQYKYKEICEIKESIPIEL